MGRPATIHVDRVKLLQAIGRSVIADVRAIDAELGGRTQYGYGARRDLERQRNAAFWQPQDLERWAGRLLTASERIRHQEAIRQLDAAGLIDRDGRRVALTAAGWAGAGLEQPANR